MLFDVRKILAFPAVYIFFQNLVRKKEYPAEYVDKYIKPKEGDFILDIGCGPAEILEHLPQVKYYGFDLSPEYINEAKKRYGDRGYFFCQEVNEATAPAGKSLDIVLANNVLHHLNDEEAARLFRLASNCLKPGGRLVTTDGCHAENEGLISKIMLFLDRGQHVRNKEGYLELAHRVFNNVEHYFRTDTAKIPVGVLIMCCKKE